jgi:hypothetical protein
MGRTVSLGILDQVRVATPCTMRWEHMQPVDSDRVRHCGSCNLNVYNLSGMAPAEAEALVSSRLADAGVGGRLCIRMFARTDGTLIARDCPVGLRAARSRLVRAVSRLAAAVALFTTAGVFARGRDRQSNMTGLSRVQPFATICSWLRPRVPTPRPVMGEAFIMGKMATPKLPGR